MYNTKFGNPAEPDKKFYTKKTMNINKFGKPTKKDIDNLLSAIPVLKWQVAEAQDRSVEQAKLKAKLAFYQEIINKWGITTWKISKN